MVSFREDDVRHLVHKPSDQVDIAGYLVSLHLLDAVLAVGRVGRLPTSVRYAGQGNSLFG